MLDLYVESKKQNKQTKQIRRYRVCTDACQMEWGLGSWVKRVKGLTVQIGSHKTVTGM